MHFELKLAKIIRILTIAPIGALAILTLLFISQGKAFGNPVSYLLSIIYLVLLPVLAYPLQAFLPGFKKQGRDGQRNLAILMANMGYLLGIISISFLDSTKILWTIYLVYFFSGILIIIFNKLIKIKASGHACGIVGPVALGIYFTGFKGLIPGVLILLLVYWSSLKMKRHSITELLWGSLLPLISLFMAHIILSAAIHS